MAFGGTAADRRDRPDVCRDGYRDQCTVDDCCLCACGVRHFRFAAGVLELADRFSRCLSSSGRYRLHQLGRQHLGLRRSATCRRAARRQRLLPDADAGDGAMVTIAGILVPLATRLRPTTAAIRTTGLTRATAAAQRNATTTPWPPTPRACRRDRRLSPTSSS